MNTKRKRYLKKQAQRMARMRASGIDQLVMSQQYDGVENIRRYDGTPITNKCVFVCPQTHEEFRSYVKQYTLAIGNQEHERLVALAMIIAMNDLDMSNILEFIDTNTVRDWRASHQDIFERELSRHFHTEIGSFECVTVTGEEYLKLQENNQVEFTFDVPAMPDADFLAAWIDEKIDFIRDLADDFDAEIDRILGEIGGNP